MSGWEKKYRHLFGIVSRRFTQYCIFLSFLAWASECSDSHSFVPTDPATHVLNRTNERPISSFIPTHDLISSTFHLISIIILGLARGIGRKYTAVLCRLVAVIPLTRPILGASSPHSVLRTRRWGSRTWRSHRDRSHRGRDSGSIGCWHSRVGLEGNRRGRLKRHCWRQRHRSDSPQSLWVVPGSRPL
jgi:hypothetical protein